MPSESQRYPNSNETPTTTAFETSQANDYSKQIESPQYDPYLVGSAGLTLVVGGVLGAEYLMKKGYMEKAKARISQIEAVKKLGELTERAHLKFLDFSKSCGEVFDLNNTPKREAEVKVEFKRLMLSLTGRKDIFEFNDDQLKLFIEELRMNPLIPFSSRNIKIKARMSLISHFEKIIAKREVVVLAKEAFVDYGIDKNLDRVRKELETYFLFQFFTGEEVKVVAGLVDDYIYLKNTSNELQIHKAKLADNYKGLVAETVVELEKQLNSKREPGDKTLQYVVDSIEIVKGIITEQKLVVSKLDGRNPGNESARLEAAEIVLVKLTNDIDNVNRQERIKAGIEKVIPSGERLNSSEVLKFELAEPALRYYLPKYNRRIEVENEIEIKDGTIGIPARITKQEIGILFDIIKTCDGDLSERIQNMTEEEGSEIESKYSSAKKILIEVLTRARGFEINPENLQELLNEFMNGKQIADYTTLDFQIFKKSISDYGLTQIETDQKPNYTKVADIQRLVKEVEIAELTLINKIALCEKKLFGLEIQLNEINTDITRIDGSQPERVNYLSELREVALKIDLYIARLNTEIPRLKS